MASKTSVLLDNISKILNEKISDQSVSQDYTLAQIFDFLCPNNPSAKYFLAKIYYFLEFYSQAENYSNQALSLLENIENKTKYDYTSMSDMYYCKAKSLYLQKKNKELQALLSLLESKGGQFSRTSAQIRKFDLELFKRYQRNEEEQRQEAIKVFEHFKRFKIDQSQDYYILPMSWFRRWKAYINFNKHNNLPSEEHQDCMDEEYEFSLGPGPIIDESLLETCGNNAGNASFPSFLHDCEKQYEDFCLNLRLGLVDNNDYLIVDMRLFEFLYSKYKGLRIKRSPYRASENSQNLCIEIFLKPITFLINPLNNIFWEIDPNNFLKYQSRTYISKFCTVEDLKNKLKGIYELFYVKPPKNSYFSYRLWKMESCENFHEYFKNLSRERPPIKLNAKLLFDDKMQLEDADISEEDLILVEVREENWFFKVSESQTPENKKREPVLTKLGVNFDDLVRHYDIDLKNKFTSDSRNGLVGLQNLGNTCFMNSGLQCLINSYKLSEYFFQNHFIQYINVKNPLGLKGLNAVTYASLVKDVWQGRKSSVSPWDLKKVISKTSSRFSGYSQQDSQEFVSYLLDGLHEDLNRVINKPIVQEVESKGRPDEIVAAESWENHLKRNDSIIVDLFHGQFKSKIICPSQSCGKVSITFDPFQMVSLPIPVKDISKAPIYYIQTGEPGKSPEKTVLSMNSSCSVAEVKRMIAKFKQTKEENLQIYSIQSFTIKEKISDDKDVKYLIECPGFPFIYDLTLGDETTATDFHAEDYCLLQINVNQESSWFYDNNKDISYPRMKYVKKNASANDIHIIVYEILRPYLKKLWGENNNNTNNNNNNSAIKNSNNTSISTQEYELKVLKESLYKLSYMGTINSQNNNNNKKKINCLLCGKTNCKGCKLPFLDNNSEEISASSLCDEEKVIKLEVRFSKNVKKESLGLNFYKEVEFKSPDLSSSENSALTIYDCITQFIQAERLEKENSWYCSNCKDHKLALKKMDIYKTSTYLILHLKRFKTSRISSYGSYFGFSSSMKKITSTISFPLKDLDLSNFILEKKNHDAILYDLYAVSNHYGSLEGGHYTAYALNELDGKWYEFDDAHVRRINEKDIVTSAAYILFYKRKEK